jgi:hypothetical protein
MVRFYHKAMIMEARLATDSIETQSCPLHFTLAGSGDPLQMER